MDYNQIFELALTQFVKDYEAGKIRIISERDLQAHLFYSCRKLIESERDYEKPIKVHAELSVFSKRSKVDLVLGNNEVLIELKVEPEYPGVSKPVVFTTKREAGGSGGSIEEDIEKIEKYAQNGKSAHVVVLDEDGRHKKKMVQLDWKKLSTPTGQAHLLHYFRQP